MVEAPPTDRPTRRGLPHPFVLMFVGIALASVATYVLPAGEFDRIERITPSGESVTAVVPGTYHSIASTPVGPIGMLASVQKGLVESAEIVFFVFIVGGAFVTIERTGAIEAGIAAMLAHVQGKTAWALVPLIVLFSLGGATFGMSEEAIAFVPMFLLLSRRLGYDKTLGVALCFGATKVGYSFAPLNPFSVGIAQSFAELPQFSGLIFRLAVYVLALALFVVHCIRHTRRVDRDGIPEDEQSNDRYSGASFDAVALNPVRHGLVWTVIVCSAVGLVVGVTTAGWYLRELATLFLAAGIVGGLVGGLGANGTARAFVQGFRDIAVGALIIGFARAIKVVMTDGHVIDSVVNLLFLPVGALPSWSAVLGMFGAQAALHFLIPSSSGQATVTMPIVVPLCDLLHITRQTGVLAFQYGEGVTNFVFPTQASLVAVIAMAGLRFDRWLRFILPFVVQITILAIAALLVAHAIGLGPA